jgi:hypothetical protein
MAILRINTETQLLLNRKLLANMSLFVVIMQAKQRSLAEPTKGSNDRQRPVGFVYASNFAVNRDRPEADNALGCFQAPRWCILMVKAGGG